MLKTIILIFVCVYVVSKGIIDFINYVKVKDAVCNYRLFMIESGQYEECDIDYCNIRSQVIMLLCFWDWGYKHYLPKAKYEKIKPYINTWRKNMKKEQIKYIIREVGCPKNIFYNSQDAADFLTGMADNSMVDTDWLYDALVARLERMNPSETIESGIVIIERVDGE